MRRLAKFLADDSGQDLMEYALALAFVCLAAAAIFVMLTPGINVIWVKTNGTLANGNTAASS